MANFSLQKKFTGKYVNVIKLPLFSLRYLFARGTSVLEYFLTHQCLIIMGKSEWFIICITRSISVLACFKSSVCFVEVVLDLDGQSDLYISYYLYYIDFIFFNIYIYIFYTILHIFPLFSIIGYYKILNTVPRAIVFNSLWWAKLICHSASIIINTNCYKLNCVPSKRSSNFCTSC